MAAKIYNDRVDKMRVSYSENVKNAKAQVVEVSVAVVKTGASRGATAKTSCL